MKKVLMLASVASMIDQFNMQNISILKEIGYEVHVAANFEQGSTSSNERMEQFKKELNYLNIPFYQIDFSRNVMNIPRNIKAFNQIKKLMKDNKYEFVHCHSPIGGVCGRLAAKITKTKVIYTAHGFHFYKGAPIINWLLYYPIEKYLSYITDILITINKEDYDIAMNKMNAKSIYYVPGIGVDTNKFSNLCIDAKRKRKELGISPNSIIILSIGELSKRKNHEVVIRALSELSNPNIHYFIAGKGVLKEFLENLSKELNINTNVHLLGFRTDIDELCNISDIFCFPSKQEGLPVALMEAMASDNAIICSNIRGNSDLIKDGVGGYLCNPNSTFEFKTAINKLIYDKKLCCEMANFNRVNIEKFSINIVKEKMHEIYNYI